MIHIVQSTTEDESIAMSSSIKEVISIMELLVEIKAQTSNSCGLNYMCFTKHLRIMQMLWNFQGYPKSILIPSI